MIVKDAEAAAHHHERHAGLDQPPGQQRLFAEAIAAVGVPQPVRLLLDLQGRTRFAGQDHRQRLPSVMVHPLHRPADVQVAPQSIELHAQRVAVLGTGHVHARRQFQPADQVSLGNRLVLGPQMAGAPHVGMPKRVGRVGHADEGRHLRVVGPAKAGGESAHRRIAPHERAGRGGFQVLPSRGVAGLHHGGMMIDAIAAIDRADHRHAVEQARLQRQVFAKANAGHYGGNRAERPPHLHRSIGLGVPRIEMTGAAGEPEENHRLAAGLAAAGGLGSSPQHDRQRQTGDARQARLEKPPSRADLNQIAAGWLQQGPSSCGKVLRGVLGARKTVGHDSSCVRIEDQITSQSLTAPPSLLGGPHDFALPSARPLTRPRRACSVERMIEKRASQ